MAIRFRRVSRLCDPTNKEAGKKVYPVISYQCNVGCVCKGDCVCFRCQRG